MYKKLILTTALGLVMFASDSLAEDCNLTYKLEGDSYVVTGASNKSDCTTVNVPKTYEGKLVTGIGASAFIDAKSLTSVNIADSVTSIGASAFQRSALETVVIPDSVISIGDNALRETKLTRVTIPDSVISIGDRAFYSIPTLTSAEIQGTNVNIASNSFGSPNAQVQHAGDVTWSCGTDCTATVDKDGHAEFTVTGAMGGIADGFRNGITSVSIPDGVTSIERAAFIDAKSLTSVNIPDSVTSIGASAFQRSALETVVIPDSVISIGDNALRETKLTRVTIPDSVTSIGEYAFYNIPTLTSLVLPDSVISIGDRAFSATALKEIFCSKASVETGKCASLASAGNANVSKINFGYYKDDAMNDERVFYLKDENGVWQEAKRESIYEKYIADTGAIYLYDSKGNLKKMRGKKIYTIEEAVEATKNGNSFHVGLTYK